MKRHALIPHGLCGLKRHLRARNGAVSEGASSVSRSVSRTAFGRLRGAVFGLAVTVSLISAAHAQDPSVKTQPLGGGKTFNSSSGAMFGASPAVNAALPLYLQGDQLIYDTKGKKVIARGNVEIFYNNFVLTADEITYDQGANLLTAQGNAVLRDPNGNITRAERLQATDDFRDAFVQSLSVVSKDETRIAARRATRRDGNTSEYEQAKFTPCKNDAGKPPLWCISAARIVHDQQAATITYTEVDGPKPQ